MDFLTPLRGGPGLLRRSAILTAISLSAIAIAPSLQASPIPTSPPAYASVLGDLNAGRANDAIAFLQNQLAGNSTNASAHNFLCRVYFQEERWSDASRECERAVQLDPNNSLYHEWLGRAYGEEAEHSSLIRAYFLARKVRAEFETAVRLDPQNASALSDLGEFSVDAPVFLGGGLDKAARIATQLAPLDPARSDELLAQIAYQKSDFSGAKQTLLQAVQSSPHPAREWMNLASLYAKQKNFPAMQQAIEKGIAADPAHGVAFVHGASLLIRHQQNPRQAMQMLQQYLASSQQSEDEPAFQVHVKLGKLLASQGDLQGAQQEYANAHALASDYLPARQAPRA